MELPKYTSLSVMREKLSQIVSMDWGMSGDDEMELLSPVSQNVADVDEADSSFAAVARGVQSSS